MKYVLVILFSLIQMTEVLSQDEKKNAAYLELGGNAIFYSLNYERLVAQSNKFKLNARIGFATLLKEDPYFIPIEITGSLGRKNKFFEFGPGYGFTYYKDEGFGSVRLGYRAERNQSIFRAAFILFPAMTSGDVTLAVPWAGISYGLRF